VARITKALEGWRASGCDDMELTRRLIDLFFVSVLLDAGAGDHWRYKEPKTGHVYERSEGIAVASLDMFESLIFTTSDAERVPIVNGNSDASFSRSILTRNSRSRKGPGAAGDGCPSQRLPDL
jgi:hypothetical protein